MPDIAYLAQHDRARYVAVQEQMLLDHIDQLRRFERLAAVFVPESCVILMDRGPMDVRAYMEPEEFDAVVQRNQLTNYDLCLQFDGVIHLVTAAKGAEQFYTLSNNTARLETTLAAARTMDDRTLWAWSAHPNVRVIDNSGPDFQDKLNRSLAAILEIIGTERYF